VRTRLLRFGALVVVLLTMMPLAAQSPSMRARIDGLVGAFNATAEEFETYVREAYVPATLEQTTAEARRAFHQRARRDFGTMTVQGLERASPTRVLVTIAGSTGMRATMRLDHEAAEPHKVTGLQFEVEDEPQAAVPIHGRMGAQERSIRTWCSWRRRTSSPAPC
jgi:hypothetical protein